MGGCGCGGSGGRVHRLTFENFGPDIPSRWQKISKKWGAKFICIGPESEWDCCKLINTPAGDLILSQGAPAVVELDGDVVVKPHRTAGNDDVPLAKLDLLVFDHIPAAFPGKRVPRVYRPVDTVLSTTEASININGRAAAFTYKPLCIAGAKSLSLFLYNQSASIDMSWRLFGMRGSGGHPYPISPTGYAEAAPTYNTLTAGHREAWHLDVEIDANDHVVLFAKSASGTPTLTVEAEVRD